MSKQPEKQRSIFDLGPNIEIVHKADLATYLSMPEASLYELAQILAVNELPAKPADQTVDDYIFAKMSADLRITAGLKVVCFNGSFDSQNKAGEDLNIEQVLERIHGQILKSSQKIESSNNSNNPVHREKTNFELRFAVNRSIDARRIQIFVYAVDTNAPDQVPDFRVDSIFQPLYLVEQPIVEHSYTAEDVFNILVDRSDVKMSVTYQPDVMAGQNYFKVDQRGSQDQKAWLDQVKEQLWPLNAYEFLEIPVNKDKTRRFLVVNPQKCDAAGNAQQIATLDLMFVKVNQSNQSSEKSPTTSVTAPAAPKSNEAKPDVQAAANPVELPPLPAELLNSLNRWSADNNLKAEKYHGVLKRLLAAGASTQNVRDYFNAIQVGRLNMLKQFESALRLQETGMKHEDIVKAMAAGTDLATLN